jgi:hypothetical protein
VGDPAADLRGMHGGVPMNDITGIGVSPGCSSSGR